MTNMLETQRTLYTQFFYNNFPQKENAVYSIRTLKFNFCQTYERETWYDEDTIKAKIGLTFHKIALFLTQEGFLERLAAQTYRVKKIPYDIIADVRRVKFNQIIKWDSKQNVWIQNKGM